MSDEATMTNPDVDEQERSWGILYDKISEILQSFGTEDFIGRADYWILDDNYGFKSINIAIHRIEFLRPEIVWQLQAALVDHPDWEIKIAIDVPGKEQLWPVMGLGIRLNQIVDELQRDYLPAEFRNIRFVSRRKPG